jgi:putative acetyltransferase
MERVEIKPGKIVKKIIIGRDTVIFRYLKRSDLEEALKFANSLIRERALIGMQKIQTLKQEKKWMSKSLKEMKQGNGVKIVVEINGRFSGSAGINRKPLDANAHVCTIGMGIHSDFRGLGIGTALMDSLIQQARDVLKCKLLELSYYEHNVIAKRVYEKCGFREVGKIPKGCHYYGKYYDEIIMVKEL